ncbi:MAG TPA: M20/M25/M40 family metallo-hydrolase [Polyangiaceae bacterium]
MNRDSFLSTLGQLIALGDRLQNSVSGGKVPCERLAAEVVLARLRRYIDSGIIRAELIASPTAPERPNLILCLKGEVEETIGFVGAHFDVVPADRVAEAWTTNPFELVIDSDGTLRGRGVTDCLGHVALLTELLAELAERGRRPHRSIVVVMISNEEESNVPGIGLDFVAELGKLDVLAKGPVYWLDSADFGPTLGTGGIATWELDVVGVPGHSGMPHQCINALELAMDTVLAMSRWFRDSYPPHPNEAQYHFGSSSSLKATVIECENRKVTMIPGAVKIRGDIRLTPFYDVPKVIEATQAFVVSLERQLTDPTACGPLTRYRSALGQASIQFKPATHFGQGVACRLDSDGLRALTSAIVKVRGEGGLSPSSMTGSLPLVRDLQERGFDVQITGFGRQVAYHAPNEFGVLKDFEDGYAILLDLVESL